MDLWLLAGTLTWALVRLASGVLCTVNLSTGLQGTTSQGGCTSTLLQTSGSWFQVRVTGNVPAAGMNIAVFLSQVDTASPSYAGGTGTIFLGTGVFGPKLNQQSVTTWRSHAGSGGSLWNLTNGAVSLRSPQVSNTAFGPAVRFDGVSNFLVSSTVAQSEPFTELGKFIWINASGSARWWDGVDAADECILYNSIATNTGVLSVYNGNVVSTVAGTWSLNVPFKAAGIYTTAAGGGLRVLTPAGVTQITGNPGNTLIRKGMTLGAAQPGTQPSNGYCFWHMIYSRALSILEIDMIFAQMP